jgi:hypothetical protein
MSEAGSLFTPFPLLATQVAFDRGSRATKHEYRGENEPSFLELFQEVLPCSRKKRASLSQGELMEREFLRQRRQSMASGRGSLFDIFNWWTTDNVGSSSRTPQRASEPLLAPIREVAESEDSARHTFAQAPTSPITIEEPRARAHPPPSSSRLGRRAQRRSSVPDTLTYEYSAGSLSVNQSPDSARQETAFDGRNNNEHPIKPKKSHKNPVVKLANKARSQRGLSSDHLDDKAPRRHIANLPMRLWKTLAQAFSRSASKEGPVVHVEMTPMPTRPSSPAPREQEVPGSVAVMTGRPGDSMMFRRLSRTPTGDLLEQSFHVERNEVGHPH